MNSVRLPIFLLVTLAAMATMLASCSSSGQTSSSSHTSGPSQASSSSHTSSSSHSSGSGELRSAEQAKSFVVAVSRGGTTTGWHLVGGAHGEAARVWAERRTIHDLGQRLRREGKAWTCQLAEDAGQLGTVGHFNSNDRRGVVKNAVSFGAKRDEIDALLRDVYKLANPDLIKATAAVCG